MNKEDFQNNESGKNSMYAAGSTECNSLLWKDNISTLSANMIQIQDQPKDDKFNVINEDKNNCINKKCISEYNKEARFIDDEESIDMKYDADLSAESSDEELEKSSDSICMKFNENSSVESCNKRHIPQAASISNTNNGDNFDNEAHFTSNLSNPNRDSSSRNYDQQFIPIRSDGDHDTNNPCSTNNLEGISPQNSVNNDVEMSYDQSNEQAIPENNANPVRDPLDELDLTDEDFVYESSSESGYEESPPVENMNTEWCSECGEYVLSQYHDSAIGRMIMTGMYTMIDMRFNSE